MTDNSDARLIERAKSGSAAAFGQLIDRHQQAIRAFLRRLCLDDIEAEDIAQLTFLAAWRRIETFRGSSSLRSWLCAIAWREAKGANRAAFRYRRRDSAFQAAEALHTPGAASQEDKVAMQQALAALTPEQRAAITLCLVQDFSHAEAAAVLGLPIGTVKSHVFRGRSRLLDLLGDRI
jgi:RNA polymerase sigma-70 factor (ECF subfamily)